MSFTILPPAEQQTGYTILPPAEAEPRGMLDSLARGAGLAGRAVLKAGAAIPGMVGDAANTAINFGLRAVGAPTLGMPSQSMDRGIDAVTPTPETATERVLFEDVAPAVLSGGALARGAAALPGGVARALAANPGMQAVAGGTGAGAAAVAREQGADPMVQLLAGLSTGMLTPAALELARTAGGAAVRGGRQAFKPFTQGGREEVVGSALSRMAVDPKSAAAALDDVPEFVKGSKPTTAQATRDIGLIQAERALESKEPLFAQRRVGNNAARNELLNETTGSKADLAKAQKARADRARVLYDEAFKESPRVTPEIADEIAELKARPAFQAAVRKGAELMAEEGDAAVKVKQGGAPRPPASINQDMDDIVAAVRKMGGLNPADEAIGSLANDMRFGQSFDGPVFRKQTFGGSNNRTHTTAGHSLEEMARKLHAKGYISEPNAFDEVVEKLYDSSKGVGEHFSIYRRPPNDDPMAAALERLTQQLEVRNAPKGDGGIDFAKSGTKLAHYTKLALDDMIEQAGKRGQANEQRVLMGTRDKLLGLIENGDFSPGYKRARETYAAMSKPVDALEAGQEVRKGTRQASTDVAGNRILSPGQWQTKVMDRIDELGERMTTKQIANLKAIGADLDRAALSDTAGRAAGSNTFQNLSTANLLGAALGNKLANNAIAQTAARPLGWLYKLPEQQVQDLLTQAMLDPSLARALMRKATPGNVQNLAEGLKFKARAIGLGAALGSGEVAGQRE